jgi:hypothetical protein
MVIGAMSVPAGHAPNVNKSVVSFTVKHESGMIEEPSALKRRVVSHGVFAASPWHCECRRGNSNKGLLRPVLVACRGVCGCRRRDHGAWT